MNADPQQIPTLMSDFVRLTLLQCQIAVAPIANRNRHSTITQRTSYCPYNVLVKTHKAFRP
ncbi:MAG: hypothetical protein KME11_14110 [Timaviella obliquedivisa GSE-PSE-MK23-08B]|nr:hypothetical protein [Timaviella obliquedivisa GSE-PSE-MK23-08B]